MLILKQNIAQTVPVKLIDDDNPPYGKGGVAATDLTLYCSKEDGVSYPKSVSAANWKEVSSVNQTGEYRLALSATDLNQTGFFTFTIAAAAVIDYSERIKVDDVVATDIFARLGTPVAASVSADIAEVSSDVKADFADIGGTLGKVKQAVMGKQKLALNLTPPRHYIYDTDGSVLQQANVNSDATERTYDPL